MGKKEHNFTDNVRARYTSPRVKVVKIHAQSHILSESNIDTNVRSNAWTNGSESTTGFGGEE